MSTTTTFPDGTLIRVTERSVSGDVNVDGEAAHPGVFEVYTFVPGAEGDDPNGRDYYLLDIPDFSFGGNCWAYPEHVEIVMTAEQMNAREVPTAQQVASYLASAAHHGFNGDVIESIVETDTSASNGVFEMYGKTNEGLRFSALVQVLSVSQTD